MPATKAATPSTSSTFTGFILPLPSTTTFLTTSAAAPAMGVGASLVPLPSAPWQSAHFDL